MPSVFVFEDALVTQLPFSARCGGLQTIALAIAVPKCGSGSPVHAMLSLAPRWVRVMIRIPAHCMYAARCFQLRGHL
jgi:hypothetical protein